jgi:pilus assembly protein FimV
VVKQYTESQYDDDLTLGSDDYDDSYYSDADDLFELSTNNESPISRLKSLVLSIDWEITDDVLRQFNEELVDLRGIWAGETINLVYVQALEKLSKYIYQNKADSHPSAIKLLLTFYYNLEKIVSGHDIPDEQKREILLEDVKRFENLKRQIKVQPVPPRPVVTPAATASAKITKSVAGESELRNLKAIVLGIDWEITEQDLNDLRKEVFRLEAKYSESRPKLILLQGIGTLAAYIKLKKSNSHPDAFKVLQHFYECLESIVQRPMSLEEEKSILFPAVEKFNKFKSLLGLTISAETIAQNDDGDLDEEAMGGGAAALSPALADVDEETEQGFQADREAMALGLKDPTSVTSHIDHFFGESDGEPEPLSKAFVAEVREEPIAAVDLFAEEGGTQPVNKDFALQGVDVGEDEDDLDRDEGDDLSSPVAAISDETAALTHIEEEDEEAEVAGVDAGGVASADEEILGATEAIFPEANEEAMPVGEISGPTPDREMALLGVDVETDADDDSDELSLPMMGEELAPALVAADEESLFSATSLEKSSLSEGISEDISGTIDSLFEDEVPTPIAEKVAGIVAEEPSPAGPAGTAVEEAPGALDWQTDLAVEAANGEPVFEQEADEAVGDDLFAAINQQDEPVDVLALSDTDEEETVSTNAPAAVTETDEAVAAFFTEDQEESDAAVDESDIEDLFDSLETDFSTEPPGTTTDVALEEEVALFFEETTEKADTTPATGFELGEAVTAGVVTAALAGTVAAVSMQGKEEEVVFELVEEDSDEEPTILAAEDFGDVAPPLSEMDGESVELSTFEEDAPQWDSPQALPMPFEEPLSQGPLAGLNACIDSLKLELSDTILNGMFAEINALRQQWVDCPLEKTFLQLISTVTQHIDSYRYESSAEAYGLLVSTYQSLAEVSTGDERTNQEMLLAATLKVLEWQQGMLSRQAVQVGDQLTFVDPLRTESRAVVDGDAQVDFDAAYEHTEAGGDTDAILAEQASARHQDPPQVVTTGASGQPPAGDADARVSLIAETFAGDLKHEIAALRQALQMEIAELRRELRGDEGKGNVA